MDELTSRMGKFRFKGIVVILLVFLAMAVILFIELSGVHAIRHRNRPDLLPDEKTFTKAEVCATLEKKALLLYDSGEISSSEAYNELAPIFDDMKVGHRVVDVSQESIPDFKDYSQVIVFLADLTPLGNTIVTLSEWVYNGGQAWFPLTLETNAYSGVIQQQLGIDDMSFEYYAVKNIYLCDGFMVGGGRSFSITHPFECAKTVVLAKDRTTVYAAAENADGVPLVWRTKYGEGTFVVDNIGIYERAMRGFYAASYSLIGDVSVYPVINASAYYLDDFPSQIPSGKSEYITRDYQTTIREFYINIWWPDMMNFSDKYGIVYTGLAIESYDDDVDGRTDARSDTGTFINFGNMLLRKGGELGYHGYNHQPLVFSNKSYKGLYDYKTWQSEGAMKSAFDHLVDFCDTLFPGTEFVLYVPPSNLLSDEGRAFLTKYYPQIKTISGIYFDDADFSELDFGCMQEFDVDENGIVDQPRIISGFILDEFQNIAAVSELNLHFVNSHFTHPDDALDPERGAELGWEEMKRRFESFLSWLYGSAPCLRNLTGTESSAAVQRYIAIAPNMRETEDGMRITIDNFYDQAQLFVRFNEKNPDNVSGGTLTHLTGGLYLLVANESVVEITLK